MGNKAIKRINTDKEDINNKIKTKPKPKEISPNAISMETTKTDHTDRTIITETVQIMNRVKAINRIEDSKAMDITTKISTIRCNNTNRLKCPNKKWKFLKLSRLLNLLQNRNLNQ
jgi:hypothetical protein